MGTNRRNVTRRRQSTLNGRTLSNPRTVRTVKLIPVDSQYTKVLRQDLMSIQNLNPREAIDLYQCIEMEEGRRTPYGEPQVLSSTSQNILDRYKGITSKKQKERYASIIKHELAAIV